MSNNIGFPLATSRKAIGGLGVVVLVIAVIAVLAFFGFAGLHF
jgi:hypothetical protein